MSDTIGIKKYLFFKRAFVTLLCLGILYIFVEDLINDRQIKREMEADPYWKSLSIAADTMNMVKGRSFTELNFNERHKVMMKCAEAYALVTLPSAQLPDDDTNFRKYIYGLSIISHTHYLSENVNQVNQAINMVRDYLWSLYDGYYADGG